MPWDPPGQVDDQTIAALPYPTAQRLLSAGRPLPDSLVSTVCEWHSDGPDGDPNQGSYALVRLGSDLEDLVGERLKITYGRKIVYAYCLRTFDLDDDLSLTRTLFVRLDALALTNIPVLVEVLG